MIAALLRTFDKDASAARARHEDVDGPIWKDIRKRQREGEIEVIIITCVLSYTPCSFCRRRIRALGKVRKALHNAPHPQDSN